MEENNLQQPVTPQQPEVPVQPVYQQPMQPEVPIQPVYQQPMQPANPYGQVPPVPPQGQLYSPIPPVPAEGGKKKGKGGLIAIIIAAAVLLLAAAGLLVYLLLANTPEAKLKKGFANLAKEMAAYGNPMNEAVDFDAIADRMLTGATTLKLSLNVTAGDDSDTVGVDIVRNYDYPNRQMDTDFSISAYNIDFLQGNLKAKDDILYVSMPDIVKDTYSVNLATLGEDYNASDWAWQFDMDVDDSYSLDLFPGEANSETDLALTADVEKAIRRNLRHLAETMIVEDSGTAVEIERAGKTITCNGIRVVLDKDAVNRLLEDLEEVVADSPYAEAMQDVFAVRLMTNLEIYVYLDGKNRIVNIATPRRIGLQDSLITNFGFSLVFSGDERTLDKVTGTVKLLSDEGESVITIDRQARLKKGICKDVWKIGFEEEGTDIKMDMGYESSYNLDEQEFGAVLEVKMYDNILRMEIAGSYEDVVKGERFTLNLGKMNMLMDGETALKMSGTVSVLPFEGTITVPSAAKDLFSLSADEFQALVMEVYQSVYSYIE